MYFSHVQNFFQIETSLKMVTVIFSKAKNIKAKNKLINQKTGEKKNKMRQQT